MSAAARVLSDDREHDWLDELEEIAEGIDSLTDGARDTVRAMVESFLHDSDVSEREADRAHALLGRFERRAA